MKFKLCTQIQSKIALNILGLKGTPLLDHFIFLMKVHVDQLTISTNSHEPLEIRCQIINFMVVG